MAGVTPADILNISNNNITTSTVNKGRRSEKYNTRVSCATSMIYAIRTLLLIIRGG